MLQVDVGSRELQPQQRSVRTSVPRPPGLLGHSDDCQYLSAALGAPARVLRPPGFSVASQVPGIVLRRLAGIKGT